MPRKPAGEAPLTPAQRQALQRQRRALQADSLRDALRLITEAKTIAQARQIAAAALST